MRAVAESRSIAARFTLNTQWGFFCSFFLVALHVKWFGLFVREKQPAKVSKANMQTEDEDEASCEEYVARSDFTGSSTDQVRETRRPPRS